MTGCESLMTAGEVGGVILIMLLFTVCVVGVVMAIKHG